MRPRRALSVHGVDFRSAPSVPEVMAGGRRVFFRRIACGLSHRNEGRSLEQHRWDAQKFEHPFGSRCIFGRGIPDWRELGASGEILAVCGAGSHWNWRLQHDPLQRHIPRQPSGWAHPTALVCRPSRGAGSLTCRPVITFPHRRQRRFSSTGFPRMRAIQATEGNQSLLGRQI